VALAELAVGSGVAAGVPTTSRRFDGAIHGFWRWLAAAKLSRAAVDEVAAALRARLD